MKRLLIVAFVAIAPVLSFADFQAGLVTASESNAVYDSAGFATQMPYLILGIEGRYRIGILQLGATAMLIPSLTRSESNIVVHPDAGISLDIKALRLGIGIGPNLLFDPTQGYNLSLDTVAMKISADLNFYRFSVGIMGFHNVSLTQSAVSGFILTSVALTIMYKFLS